MDTAAQEAGDILVVEDDPLIVAFIRTALTKRGYRVRSAATGAEALEGARSADLDLMLLDLGMPDIDGLDVLQQLRAEGCTIPVVVLTSRSDPADRATAQALGVEDYLVKPIGLAQLFGVVGTAIRAGRRSTGSRGQHPDTRH